MRVGTHGPSLLPFLISPAVSEKEMSTGDVSAQSKARPKIKDRKKGITRQRERERLPKP